MDANRSRLLPALVALLIASASTATAHLVAALTAPAYSPFFVIGNIIIDLTPTPVKEWAIETMGNNDKPVLLTSIGVGAALLVFGGGLLWARKKAALRVFITMFSIVPLLLLFSGRSLTPEAFIPAVALIGSAQALLWFTWRKLCWSIDSQVKAERPESDVSRRAFIVASSVVVGFAAAAVVGGQAILRARTAIGNLVLPRVKEPLPPLVAAFDDVKGISKLTTSQADFYRVDTSLSAPIIDPNAWRLEIKRDGYDTKTYSYDDLLTMDLVERDITLSCVSNPVGGEYVSSGRWTGVDLNTLLRDFDPDDKAVDQLFSTSTDGYTCSTDLRAATDGRESLIAVGLNGEVLSREHGFPARLLVPGLYGFVGATKWLQSIELTTYDAKESYWTQRGWATDAPMKLATRIDTPKSLDEVGSGEVVIAGIAWAGVKGVKEVQIQVDGGSWQRAMIGKATGGQDKGGQDPDYWVQWMLPINVKPGSHSVKARCVTFDGEIQIDERASPFPEGTSRNHTIMLTAT